MKEIAKAYIPEEIENKISAKWEKAEIGKATGKAKKKVFTMMMPPANVTGALHLGHAITLTIEDILARFERMQGRDVLWLPGTDHAGIATQNVVEKRLLEKGISRENLGREKFLEKVWEWKEKYHSRIVEQIRKMGASCDWSREAFTLDEDCSRAVAHAFVKLFHKKLIYRDKKLVNWCPRCRTVLSDIEVEHREEEGNLYFIRYFVLATDRSVCVATTRPETMLG
ncbi:class I tRNA ligase family protein, partial [Patescibacteria group bacterium]|nr:class I tRNA ligase family protein [Patescibacteria group bacterium]